MASLQGQAAIQTSMGLMTLPQPPAITLAHGLPIAPGIPHTASAQVLAGAPAMLHQPSLELQVSRALHEILRS